MCPPIPDTLYKSKGQGQGQCHLYTSIKGWSAHWSPSGHSLVNQPLSTMKSLLLVTLLALATAAPPKQAFTGGKSVLFFLQNM